ncbi:hypothetical protein BpHYR1_045700, partial [Brachionus plicatilis]
NKILPNFKISRFYHLKIQGKLFTIFRLTRFCKIDIDNDQEICYLKLNPHISMRILNSRLKYKYPVSYRVQFYWC